MLRDALYLTGTTGILISILQLIQQMLQIIHIMLLHGQIAATNKLVCRYLQERTKYNYQAKTKPTQISVPNTLVLALLITYQVMA